MSDNEWVEEKLRSLKAGVEKLKTSKDIEEHINEYSSMLNELYNHKYFPEHELFSQVELNAQLVAAFLKGIETGMENQVVLSRGLSLLLRDGINMMTKIREDLENKNVGIGHFNSGRVYEVRKSTP